MGGGFYWRRREGEGRGGGVANTNYGIEVYYDRAYTAASVSSSGESLSGCGMGGNLFFKRRDMGGVMGGGQRTPTLALKFTAIVLVPRL